MIQSRRTGSLSVARGELYLLADHCTDSERPTSVGELFDQAGWMDGTRESVTQRSWLRLEVFFDRDLGSLVTGPPRSVSFS